MACFFVRAKGRIPLIETRCCVKIAEFMRPSGWDCGASVAAAREGPGGPAFPSCQVMLLEHAADGSRGNRTRCSQTGATFRLIFAGKCSAFGPIFYSQYLGL